MQEKEKGKYEGKGIMMIERGGREKRENVNKRKRTRKKKNKNK